MSGADDARKAREDLDRNSAGRLLTDLLTAYSTWIGAGLLVFAAGVWAGFIPLDVPEVPRPLTVAVLTAGGTALLAYLPALTITRWLYDPDRVYLWDVDARDEDVALWALSPETWEDLSVRAGELYQVRALVECYECRHYDPAGNQCVGTWRGSASDLELVRDRARIDEVRQKLEDDAREGLHVRMKAGSIVRDAVKRITNHLVLEYEDATIPEGRAVERAIERARQDAGLGDQDGDGTDGAESGTDGAQSDESQGTRNDEEAEERPHAAESPAANGEGPNAPGGDGR